MTYVPALNVFSKADLADVNIAPRVVLDAVHAALAEMSQPGTQCPRKIKVEVPESVSYSMAGRSSSTNTVGFKTSYTHWLSEAEQEERGKNYYTTLTLYDDTSGHPIALLDAAAVGALRTPAVSALLAQYAGARPESALIIGSGVQGQSAAPFLLEVFKTLTTIYLAGSHRAGLERAADIAYSAAARLDCAIDVVIVADPTTVSPNCDLIIGAAGPNTRCIVTAADVADHATVVVVGYGIAADICHQARRIITTSAEQMNITGRDYADNNGLLPSVDAELPEMLKDGCKLPSVDGITFCYNSGLVLTDIAVGRILAEKCLQQGHGVEVRLW